jgi:hypothetical protein
MSNNSLSINAQAAARTIADYFACAVTIEGELERISYNHMGATLTDTVLQAGLNYRSVVLPRVRHVLVEYPDAQTTTKFWTVLREIGPNTVLRWSHPEKIDRLNRLIELLLAYTIETEAQLSEWLSSNAATEELLSLKGIGPKTVDYLKILVGIPTIAVDRHVKALFKILDLEFSGYEDFRSVLCHAAEILRIPAHILDGIIWQHLSKNGSPTKPAN